MNARALLLRSIAIAFGAVALVATSASAQDATSLNTSASPATPAVSQPSAPAAVTSGPALENASVAVHRTAPAAPLAPPAAGRGFDQGTKLMILGGAAILTGIVIGGNAGHAISIGGAVVGLIGLYEYLQ